jgi:hypothetical protein
VKFCFDISTEFIHAINLFLGDCMDQMWIWTSWKISSSVGI